MVIPRLQRVVLMVAVFVLMGIIILAIPISVYQLTKTARVSGLQM
jgi:hypothetical protein